MMMMPAISVFMMPLESISSESLLPIVVEARGGIISISKLPSWGR